MGNDAIDWSNVKGVLIVRLRSIGDTVLATPSLIALKRFLPHAQIDILLEDWVAPLLVGHRSVDNVIAVGKSSLERFRVARQIRQRKYDLVINLHGGTTATFFVGASGARHRIGYAELQYSFIYNHLLASASDYWQKDVTHSAEQQLALLGFVGVPVEDRPKSHLDVTNDAARSIENTISSEPFALIHPSTAFHTKQWPVENFARTAEFLAEKGMRTIAISSKNESQILDQLKTDSKVSITTFDDLSLPEITALAAKAKVFVGNDSGIAHIAAAVQTPSVVIFGSSNRNHWRPWTDAPNEIVFNEFKCQPCPGYECKEFGDAPCIRNIAVENVTAGIERVLQKQK